MNYPKVRVWRIGIRGWELCEQAISSPCVTCYSFGARLETGMLGHNFYSLIPISETLEDMVSIRT